MHGRLKVKTTAEKEAERQKERQKKKLIFQKCMSKIKGMYLGGDRSIELLKMITKILENIPEFGTLWNWRRNILIELFKKDNLEKLEPGNVDENKDKEVDDVAEKKEMKVPGKLELISSEKQFVARCLEMNPKAYSLWSHRTWLVEQNQTDAVLKEELNLCNLFLKYDERNFHCWDYRRFIVKVGGIPQEDELEVSTGLIERNFSNYSAWHYRSTLLDTSDVDVVREELEWVQNAYFTDPSDQSVWLYYQWLLGREEQADSLLVVMRDVGNSTLHLLLNNSCYTPPSIKVTSSMVTLGPLTSHKVPSRLWSCEVPADSASQEILLELGNSTVVLKENSILGVSVTLKISPRITLTAPRDIVQEQLASIRELYELEPDNKWVILTLLYMVNNCYESKTKDQITEIRNLTVKLCQVDPSRTGYYRELWSKMLCGTAVTAWWANVTSREDDDVTSREDGNVTSREDGDVTSREDGNATSREQLNLSKKYLTQLAHTDYMFYLQDLNVASNNISSLTGFSALVELKSLNISHNKLSNLEGLENCKKLTLLDASYNLISNSCGILSCSKCRLQTMRLAGNPLTDSDVYPACMVQACPMLCTLDDREL